VTGVPVEFGNVITGVVAGVSTVDVIEVVVPMILDGVTPSDPLRCLFAASIRSAHSLLTACLFTLSSRTSASVLHPLVAILFSVAANASSSNSIFWTKSSTVLSSAELGV
jgi:hypothetical protein